MKKAKNFIRKYLRFEIIAETYRKERKSHKLDLAINGVYCIDLYFLSIKKEKKVPESKGLRHLAFAVDDVVAWMEFLRSKSVEVQDIRIDEITQKKFTFFYDPNRQPLELYDRIFLSTCSKSNCNGKTRSYRRFKKGKTPSPKKLWYKESWLWVAIAAMSRLLSDIDILVEQTVPLGFRFLDMIYELDELFKKEVQVVSKNGIKPKYLNAIEQDLIYV